MKSGSKLVRLRNSIRFSGYRLIQELGLLGNGEIYEEIVGWGKSMTVTTTTSEKVVYRAVMLLRCFWGRQLLRLRTEHIRRTLP